MIFKTIDEAIQNRPYGGYQMIVSDPPWTFETYSEKGALKSPSAKYKCMSLEDIKAMPVEALAAKDAILWLWVYAPMLPESLEVMAAWGFDYTSTGVWNKKGKSKKLKCGCLTTAKYQWGQGYVLRSTHEPFIIGKRGNPKTSRGIPSAFDGLRREHSRKPEEGYKLQEKMINNARRFDMFSRQERTGWDCFGDEADKFEKQKTDVELPLDK